MSSYRPLLFIFLMFFPAASCNGPGKDTKNPGPRLQLSINCGWKFSRGDPAGASRPCFDDSGWRVLDLPHDWSIEGEFSADHPSTPGGGALPGGIGWYRKTFSVPDGHENDLVFIEFDGVYQESEVWINGHYLGVRPNGYISFRYELSPWMESNGATNTVAVRVDNSLQPNSRWYSGSGIYRDVRLVFVQPVHVDQWGIFVTTPEVSVGSATVKVATSVSNRRDEAVSVRVRSVVLDPGGRNVAEHFSEGELDPGSVSTIEEEMQITEPELWDVDSPKCYTLVSEIRSGDTLLDRVETTFGIRWFEFDAENGFSLNGTPMKLKGVCNHHDLGCLGAAAYPRAIERQLELLKEMGCNAIRTSHNPPSPVLLDLCDRMGFLVMDETFDMWEMKKVDHDYHLHWEEWYERDLTDHIRRDRNHPSVILWSIGNEIIEQWDPSGREKTIRLAGIVRDLDDTRPVISGCNFASPENHILSSGALDLIGYNYHLENFREVPHDFPGMPFLATETTSALATRGSYDMPSDGIRIWPVLQDSAYPVMNADHTCSSYDNCHVPWGSTHQAALRIMEENDFVSGIFVWTGFDYLGEPTPYWWPSRSSYFGILDLAGFPKDAYYLYRSRWTHEPVLHLFPHWNWEQGDTVDIWTYTSCKEVELFLNGGSLGKRGRQGDDLHIWWRVPYVPGRLEARGLFEGRELTAAVETAGEARGIRLSADRSQIRADGMDLSFITVEVIDGEGRVVPRAGNRVEFTVEGEGELAGVDNGLQTSLESFTAPYRNAFNGKCLAVIRSTGRPGKISISAVSDQLEEAQLTLSALTPNF